MKTHGGTSPDGQRPHGAPRLLRPAAGRALGSPRGVGSWLWALGLVLGLWGPLSAAPAARAALVWDRVGPAVRGEGLTAVTTDPDDSSVAWVAGGGSVWVTDDAGATWSLVLTLPGRVGRRAGGDTGDEAQAGDGSGQPGSTGGDGQLNDEVEIVEDDSGNEYTDDGTDVDDLDQPGAAGVAAGGGAGTRAVPPTPQELEAAIGSRITRLRVLHDRVYACTGRGLWWVPRAARGAGAGREIRFGRREVVLDVAWSNPHQLWIATTRGLLQGGLEAVALPVFGPLGNQIVYALHPAPGGLAVAAEDGLWRQTESGFVRLGLALGGAAVDLTAGPGPAQMTALTPQAAHVLSMPSAVLQRSVQVPAAARVAVGRDGALWVVGPSGAWVEQADGGFAPRRDGLTDLRLADVAAPRGQGPVFLWVVGRFGVARLVTEVERVWSRRARELAVPGEDLPSAWATVEAANRARGADFDAIDTWRETATTAWALPQVQLWYQNRAERVESRPYIPTLDRQVLDEVRVVPAYDEFKVLVVWDLGAAFLALGAHDGLGDAGTRATVRAAILARRDVRRRVVPLYNEWRAAQVRHAATAPPSVRAAIKDQLRLEHLEADLYAMTGGWFPQLAGQRGREAGADATATSVGGAASTAGAAE